jgi:hypothetical protein
MPDTLHRLDVIHEVRFARPAIELAGETPQVLKSFFQLISPHHNLSSEHISALGGNALSDLLVRFSMYNGQAIIELRADRMSIRLQNVNNTEDFDIAQSLLTLAHDGLSKVLPDVPFRESAFTANSWFIMEGGAVAADALLARNALPAAPLDQSAWGAENLKYRVRALSRNDADGWTALLHAEPSLVAAANLFFVMELTFHERGLRPISDQISFATATFRKIAAAIGLNLPSEGGADV